jgi:hypothetical protein
MAGEAGGLTGGGSIGFRACVLVWQGDSWLLP